VAAAFEKRNNTDNFLGATNTFDVSQNCFVCVAFVDSLGKHPFGYWLVSMIKTVLPNLARWRI
jgi:hypothetical protein